jgi:hypothetical protein
MTKDIVEPKEVELSDKQQYIQLQLTDLNNKEKNLMFQLDQVKASQQVFNQAFIEASQEVAKEVLKEEEKYGYFNTPSSYLSNPACINQKIQTSSLEKNRS